MQVDKRADGTREARNYFGSFGSVVVADLTSSSTDLMPSLKDLIPLARPYPSSGKTLADPTPHPYPCPIGSNESW